MARLLKCYGDCGNKYYKEDLTMHSNGKRYCKECLINFIKENDDRLELNKLISELYNISFPTGQMLKQIKEYREQRGFTYEGMIKTLKYLKNQPGIKFEIKFSLGIVGYKYEEALAFFKKQEELAQKAMFISKCSETEQIVIKTAKPNNDNVLKNEKIISLEELI